MNLINASNWRNPKQRHTILEACEVAADYSHSENPATNTAYSHEQLAKMFSVLVQRLVDNGKLFGNDVEAILNAGSGSWEQTE